MLNNTHILIIGLQRCPQNSNSAILVQYNVETPQGTTSIQDTIIVSNDVVFTSGRLDHSKVLQAVLDSLITKDVTVAFLTP